ncbi:MAG TPA: hypothetical protein VNR87_05660 [Flavisolibacter sp.]|nr:hypothetical protein [Flavisolibacter sp.]
MDKQTNETAVRQTQDNGGGRIGNTADDQRNREKNERDISTVDRQEGEMDNGETGGNFKDGQLNNEGK